MNTIYAKFAKNKINQALTTPNHVVDAECATPEMLKLNFKCKEQNPICDNCINLIKLNLCKKPRLPIYKEKNQMQHQQQ